jgi:uncharacterized protein YsxB (DUF464 family)
MSVKHSNMFELSESEQDAICSALSTSIAEIVDMLEHMPIRDGAEYAHMEREAEWGEQINEMKDIQKKLRCGAWLDR